MTPELVTQVKEAEDPLDVGRPTEDDLIQSETLVLKVGKDY